MELADQVASLDAVPEPFRRFYSEAEGGEGFKFDGDGFTGAVKNYGTLLGEKKAAAARIKELEGKLKSYDGIDDPEAARAAAEELKKLKDQQAAAGAGTTDEAVEDLVKKRYQRVLDDHTATLGAKDKALKDLETRLASAEEQHARLAIDSQVSMAATTDGFVPEAVEDAIEAARRIFKMENGAPVPRTADGQPMLDAKGDPLTIKDWLIGTKSSKPHWWKANANGGGATASNGNGNGAKTISRAAMAKLGPAERMAKSREGWTVVD